MRHVRSHVYLALCYPYRCFGYFVQPIDINMRRLNETSLHYATAAQTASTKMELNQHLKPQQQQLHLCLIILESEMYIQCRMKFHPPRHFKVALTAGGPRRSNMKSAKSSSSSSSSSSFHFALHRTKQLQRHHLV